MSEEPDTKNKKGKKKEKHVMRKNKVFATAAIAALAAAQMAMPVMAAKTNNNLDKIDQDDNQFTEKELRDNGHTLFSVFESEKDVSGQVSFTVPLYVTMAAVSLQEDMTVPTGYYIENTSKDGGNIGVTKVDVTALGWDIVTNDGEIAKIGDEDKKKTTMTFKLINAAAAEEANKELVFTKVDRTKSVTVTDYKTETKTNLFINAGATQAQNTVVPIANKTKLDLTMAAKIAGVDRTNSDTASAFKVVYSISALDDANKPKANTYVGDNKTEATKYMNAVKVQ